MVRVRQPGLLLGEWACLGALGSGALHGFAVSRRLSPDGDLGRVWTISRPLVYRALGLVAELGLVRAVDEQRGASGPNKVLLDLTSTGSEALATWLTTPVLHPRDVRSELLLKVVLLRGCPTKTQVLIDGQRAVFERHLGQRESEVDVVSAQGNPDPVTVWRIEFARAALAFVERLARAEEPNSEGESTDSSPA